MTREWIDPEYLNEASVLFTWLTAFIPWAVVYAPQVSALITRFPVLEVRYVGRLIAHTPLYWYRLHESAGEPITVAYHVWGVGLAVWAVAFLIATALFVSEDRVTAYAPVPIPRIIGSVLLAASGFFGVATALLFLHGFDKIIVPVGVFFMAGFGGVLLTTPQSESESS